MVLGCFVEKSEIIVINREEKRKIFQYQRGDMRMGIICCYINGSLKKIIWAILRDRAIIVTYKKNNYGVFESNNNLDYFEKIGLKIQREIKPQKTKEIIIPLLIDDVILRIPLAA